jgi:hypothetical protein
MQCKKRNPRGGGIGPDRSPNIKTGFGWKNQRNYATLRVQSQVSMIEASGGNHRAIQALVIQQLHTLYIYVLNRGSTGRSTVGLADRQTERSTGSPTGPIFLLRWKVGVI